MMRSSWILWAAPVWLLAACPSGERACVEEPGKACVWAGTGELGFNGDGLDRRETRLYWPIDVEFAPDGTPWVLDWNNHKIRKVLPDDTFVSVVGDFVGDGPPDASDLVAPGAPGETVRLNHPTDIQFLPDGKMLFMAWHNHKLRQLDPETGLVLVLAGRGGGFAGDGGPASAALFNQPKALLRGEDGSVYILDQRNFRVRRIDPEGNIATVVGVGTAGFSGDGGAPLEAQLNFEAGGNPEPSGALAMDAQGRLYVSDGLNHRIRRVDFAANTIETIAGIGTPGFAGDGGAALQAAIDNVRDMEIGPDGRLYLADCENDRIRVIDLDAGTIDTFAGAGGAGIEADGLPAAEIKLNRPMGIAFDADGALYISDTFNSRIIKVTP